ncbi:MAG: PilZ domain-containing protein [Phycisphaeraceae bacterium]|nr:PilZ domain-containing protein [Phycisphaeraceae bacterium]
MPVMDAVGDDLDLEAPDALRFERRRSEREPQYQKGTLEIASVFGWPKLIPVEVVDVSHEGLGVFCQEALPAGVAFTFYLDGSTHPSMRGHIARCTDAGNGYHIGLCCSDLLAA